MTNTVERTVVPRILRAIALCFLGPLSVFAPNGGAQGIITTVAGGGGLQSGSATSVLLPHPVDVAKDKLGNLFVLSDATAAVYKLDSFGNLTVVAGNGLESGGANGIQATSSSLNGPQAIAIDPAGNLIIADSGPSVVRRVDFSTGIMTIIAGSLFNAGFSGDGGPAISALLNRPVGVAVDNAGNIFISDSQNLRVRRIDAVTGVITTIAGNGTSGFSGDGGLATNAQLNFGPAFFPGGRVAVDSFGNLFIVDSFNMRIRRVDASTHVITTVAGNGSNASSGDGGPATVASLGLPASVAVDALGNLFIAESGGNRIREVNAASKLISTFAGNGTLGFSGDGGPATSAALSLPEGVTVDSAGNVFIADSSNNRTREVNTAGTIATIAGNGSLGDGGPATSAALFFPDAVAVDKTGNLYIADTVNDVVRRVDAVTSVITHVAGVNDICGFNGDGISAASARLCSAFGVAIDGSGNIFIADSFINRIRRVDAVTGIITTVAGNGISGFSGDGGSATNANLALPSGVALDGAGNLFIADQNNNRIRRVDAATGIITTVAGNGTSGFSGDGGLATNAALNLSSPFSGPVGLAADAAGNVFFADVTNARVRRVDASTGIITTVAGSSSSCNPAALGDGGPASSATLCFPQGVAVDPNGVLYISDNGFLAGYQRIRRVDAKTGIITTIAGGFGGFRGDGGLSTNAGFEFLRGIAFGANSLFVVDSNALRIRRVLLAPTVVVGLPAVPGSGNCIPFGCPASFGTTTYQQVYANNTFPGVVNITGIDFLDTQFLNGAVPAAGTYTLSLSYTSKSPGSLDLTNPANNITSGSQTFFSGTLPAITDGIMAFTGTPFAYDPALGNLLLTVRISGGIDSSPSLFLDFSQTPSTQTGRAFFGAVTSGNDGGLVTAFVTAGTAPPPAAVVKITPPPSVRLDALESNLSAFFFAERVSLVLPSAIAVDATLPGTYNSVGSLTPGTIPAGTVVDSFFLHADPFDPNTGVFYSGSLTFLNPILGVIALSADLDQTDAILGAPGTSYPVPGSEPFRGFELGFPDMFVISPDRKTLTFSDAVGGASDQLRIVTAAPPPQPVAPGTSTTFTSPNVINQTVTIPPDANMNGAVTMRVSFIQVSPAVFNASIAAGTNGNAFSGGKPVPAGTTCTPITGTGGNCIITENKCFDANGVAFALCPITTTTTPILLTSSYKTLSPQPNPALLIASDGQSNYAVITTGFNPGDPTISGGTKALNSDEVIGNLPGSLPTETVPPTTIAATSPTAPNGANGWFTTSPVAVILSSTDDQLVKQITYSAAGAQTIGSTTVPAASTLFQIANQGVTTISYQATDAAGNVEALKTLTVKIDTTPPSISITSPTNGASYTLNQPVAASYTCADPESSPAPSCTGPVASGSNIDTASVGGKSFTVNSTDAAGLSSTQSVTYSVSYKVCTLNIPTVAVKSGAVIPLKMFLCDFRANDVSNSGVIVHATKLIQVSTQATDAIVTAGNANPDNDFRFDSTLGPSGGYIFNLMANLPTGTYKLFFTAGNDPSTSHFLTFQVN